MAELVTEGLTNEAIARRLSVAPRTIETHVENIRRKLGVRSRAQIAAWVAASGCAGNRDRLGGSPDAESIPRCQRAAVAVRREFTRWPVPAPRWP